MLRSRVLAFVCLVVLPSAAVGAEAVKAGPASSVLANVEVTTPAPAATSVSPSFATAAPGDGKPHIGAAAPETATAQAAAASEPAKATEPAKLAPPPQPTLTAQIDLASQTMVVSEHGDRIHSWPISSGTSEFPTPRGTFRPQWMAKMWYSRKYDNAPMPNAVFINGGVAVHATSHVRSLGNPASHGCIRLAPGNAKAFYSLVQKHGLKMTRVSVFGTPKWRAPAVASRKVPAPRQQYASAQQDDSGWWFGSSQKKYQPTSAYDPGFTKQRRYRPLPPGYVYANPPQQRVYRNAYGQRVVYVQRPPQQRRYYYNNSGYGYGGGW